MAVNRRIVTQPAAIARAIAFHQQMPVTGREIGMARQDADVAGFQRLKIARADTQLSGNGLQRPVQPLPRSAQILAGAGRQRRIH